MQHINYDFSSTLEALIEAFIANIPKLYYKARFASSKSLRALLFAFFAKGAGFRWFLDSICMTENGLTLFKHSRPSY